ncbi:hypothetical protein T11_14165 [Trichinella zimbabwensis]|uniref:Uncharacterized protein n=1 Tax=Trichinella zimbabwensis TaxID=268475 RepID=A0A0V1H8D5_9BILA|nr:hypothetical protein T11_14165 [Trichinella zimbabwensis]
MISICEIIFKKLQKKTRASLVIGIESTDAVVCKVKRNHNLGRTTAALHNRRSDKKKLKLLSTTD